MQSIVRICPECRVEYQDWALRCADCNVDLIAAERSAPLPPASELECLVVLDPWEARAVAEALQRAGIPSRIDSYPPDEPIGGPELHRRGGYMGRATQVGVYVLPRDRESADAAYQEGVERSLTDAVPGAPRAAAGDGCPACGASLDAAAAACRECGLAFPEQ